VNNSGRNVYESLGRETKSALVGRTCVSAQVRRVDLSLQNKAP
jgi:hypothetical protein